jgi:hypothetical protein
MIFEAITAVLLAYQTAAPEYRNNSLYTFNVDPTNGSVIVMNTQTGELHRCTPELVCPDGLEIKKKK